jgi:hypothetical protein
MNGGGKTVTDMELADAPATERLLWFGSQPPSSAHNTISEIRLSLLSDHWRRRERRPFECAQRDIRDS